MTKRLSSIILSGFVASTMMVSSAFAQPAPSGTALETTPSELRTSPADKMDYAAEEATKAKAAAEEDAAKTKAADEAKAKDGAQAKKGTDDKKKDKPKKHKKKKAKKAASTSAAQ